MSEFPIPLPGATAETLMWARPEEVEHQAMQQLRNISTVPWVHGIRVMPDVHLGKGATVGSVIAMKQAVSPAAVGVDIGCGVVATRTNLRLEDVERLPALRAAIENLIPVGHLGHARTVNVRALGLEKGWAPFWNQFKNLHSDAAALEGRAASQMGTLGGGNHFIELCVDDDNFLWLTLHSGSRNIGKSLAERHIDIARGLSHNQDLVDRDLAVFLAGSPEMVSYRHDLMWAQEYALRSRGVMMALFKNALVEHYPSKTIVFDDDINCLAGETQVLTRNGVVPIRELAGGSHDLLTEGGIWVNAPIESFGQQQLYDIVLRRYGQTKTIRATAGHRWLLRPKVAHNRTESTTVGLRAGDRLSYVFPARPIGLAPDPTGIARGFVFGDGTANRSRSIAMFCGPKDEALLPFFVGYRAPRSYPAAPGKMVGQKRIHGLPLSWKKETPALEEEANTLYGWVAGYFAADGDVDKTGRPTLASSRRGHLELVKSICDRLGVVTHPIRARLSNEGSYNGAGVESYLMGFARDTLCEDFFIIPAHRERFLTGRSGITRLGWTVDSVTITDSVEEVFCAVVEGTHSFALEDNILTGNCHHNYVAEEMIDGELMLVTRKGAIRAGLGDLALIPGSMGTGSFVVRGLGNDASFQSASHGAGRRLSRSAAKREFMGDDEGATQIALQLGDIESRRDSGIVDELPNSYKNIDDVIANQADLVEVVQRLRTLLCVKG